MADPVEGRALTVRVLHLTDRLHHSRQCFPECENTADDQVDRNVTLDWAVIQVHRSCVAHFQTRYTTYDDDDDDDDDDVQ